MLPKEDLKRAILRFYNFEPFLDRPQQAELFLGSLDIYESFRLQSNQATHWSVDTFEIWLKQLFSSQQRISWDLFCNPALPWTPELLKQYATQINWRAFSHHPHFFALSSEDWLMPFSSDWDWDYLSAQPHFPWSAELLERYEPHWNWQALSTHSSTPWFSEGFEIFLPKLNWLYLSENTHLPWFEDFFEAHLDKWSWYNLSGNSGLPWTESLIEKYQDKWNWEAGEKCLSANPALPWSKALIQRHLQRWAWCGHHDDKANGLSGNPGLPWSIELIETFVSHWYWGLVGLAAVEELPWDAYFLKHFSPYFNTWGSCITWVKSMPWTLDLLLEYYPLINRSYGGWGWDFLGRNTGSFWSADLLEGLLPLLPLSKRALFVNYLSDNPSVWQYALQSQYTPEKVAEVLAGP